MKLCLLPLPIQVNATSNNVLKAEILFKMSFPMAKPYARWQIRLRQWYRRRKYQLAAHI